MVLYVSLWKFFWSIYFHLDSGVHTLVLTNLENTSKQSLLYCHDCNVYLPVGDFM